MTEQYVYVVVYQFKHTEITHGTYGTLEKAAYNLLRVMSTITSNSLRTENISLLWKKIIPANGLDYTCFWSVREDDGVAMGNLFIRKTTVE